MDRHLDSTVASKMTVKATKTTIPTALASEVIEVTMEYERAHGR